jgi:hypothetical protein
VRWRFATAVVLAGALTAPAAASATITGLTDIVRNNDPGLGTAVVTYPLPTQSSTADNGLLTVGSASCAPASGSAFPVGVTRVTCSGQVITHCYYDGQPGCAYIGQQQLVNDSGGFNVTVHDVEAPTLNPANLSLATPPGGTAAVGDYALHASDNVGVTSTSCSMPSGSAFPVGVTAVTCTASDAAHLTSPPKSFTVTVVPTPAIAPAEPGTGTGAGSVAVHCVVPGLVGKKLAAARKALGAAHCTLGKVKHRKVRHPKRGRVLTQTAPAGRQLAAGSKVGVTVGVR